MQLLESQAKRILKGAGINSPRGWHCSSRSEVIAAAERLGGSVYVKAQVLYGDRASRGVVRKALPGTAAQAADAIRSVEPQCDFLVEEEVPGAHWYLAVVIDELERRREIVLGAGAGAGFDPRDSSIRVPMASTVEDNLIPALEEAAAALGLKGSEARKLAETAARAGRLAHQWHTYVVEVNPIVRGQDGFVAVDAKIEIDDYSRSLVPEPNIIARHEARTDRERKAEEYHALDHRGSLRYVQLQPEDDDSPGALVVGTHSIGGGESMVVFDALHDYGLVPANYCDTSGAPSKEKVAVAAHLIASQPHISGYYFASCIASQPLSVTAQGLIEGWERADWTGPTVVRIAGNEEAEAADLIRTWLEAHELPHAVLGRDKDEWDAAQALLGLLEGVTA